MIQPLSMRWNLSLLQFGKPDCDSAQDIAEEGMVEAEIQPDRDPYSGVAQKLVDRINAGGPQDICIHGVWIYDRGHCCHSEIHPAEQVWWRDQMDDGTKLKPWGTPPVRGIFAIAFDAQLGKPAVTF